ncbi:MAG: lipoyl(octanoyl) transferase LipB [Alphaproteobacteria bacterium]|nr:lipoyl(octanoyl) transferase LipB [Alphaproteobacteria bacterium]
MKTQQKAARFPQKADWQAEQKPVGYTEAVRRMEERVRAIREAGASDLVWLLEHPPLYTAGTSAQAKDLINNDFPVHHTGRGGQYTYHGPGQRVGYVMMDLQKRGSDLRRYICDLEEWMILALKDFDVKGERRQGRVGIWVATGNSEAKIAAIGVRVRKWVSYHGVAVNLNPDLSHYNGIVPCGISEYGVTSLAKLGVAAGMADLDTALQRSWQRVFA